MRRWKADLALVFVTLIWGTTFVVVKNALASAGPLAFVATRFWIAAALLGGIVLLRRRPASPRLFLEGGLTGLFLTLGYVTQTIGLQTTEAGKAAFITGLSVVFVPLFAAVLLRQPPPRAALLGVVLATVGLGLMTLDRRLSVAAGDLWVLACALGFALHILSTGHFGPRHDPFTFTGVQLLMVALLSTLAALVFEADALLIPRQTLPAALYMAVGATALVFSVQTWSQQHTTPTHTALIFALEPVFAALFAVLLTDEELALREGIGAGLILLGMLLAEVGPALFRSRGREIVHEM